MTTITIPRKITKGEELVVISRKEYAQFLKLAKKDLLKHELNEALRDVKAGHVAGPFKNAREAVRFLRRLR